jgi:M6 family metalloprotease-like protein
MVIAPLKLVASGANPSPVVVSQPDGSSLTICQHGDEWFNWTATSDGYRIVKNKDGIFEYATLLKSGIIVPSGIKVNNGDKRNKNEIAFIDAMSKHIGVTEAQINQQRENYFPTSQLKNAASNSYFPATGTRKLLVILTNFADRTTSYTQSDFNHLMNTNLYNGDGSFRDYYREVSGGKLEVISTVTQWVKLDKSHDYYDTNVGEMVVSAIQKAADQGQNFDDFDNDHDGVIESVIILHQGSGQESSSVTTDIWSHYHKLSLRGFSEAARTIGGKIFDQYVIVPEKNGSGTSITPIGVICHEFGHALGMSDYYDTDDTSGLPTGTCTWDIMANGLWNINGHLPAHPNPYEKIKLGWVTSINLSTAGEYTLNPILTSQKLYRINSPVTTEYFLLENRVKQNFDYGIQGEGMLIYHIDENIISTYQTSNKINAGTPQGVALLSASTSSYGAVNSGFCPFPGKSFAGSFTDETNPSSLTWGGSTTQLPITDINKATNGNILFTLLPSVQAATITHQQEINKSVSIRWNPVIDESFSGYQSFAISISDWLFIDQDLGVTAGLWGNNVAFTNEKYTGSFIVFDPDAVNAPVNAYLGHKFLGCVANSSTANPPHLLNDDWVISPEIEITQSTWLSFMARSATILYGMERINVLVSESGTATSQFTKISTTPYIEVPEAWTMYKYDLSSYMGKKIRFAIQCVSDNAYMLMLDAFKISSDEPILNTLKKASIAIENTDNAIKWEKSDNDTPLTTLKNATADVSNIQYHIYRNNQLITTLSGLTNTSFAEVVNCGNYDYKIVTERLQPKSISTSTLTNITTQCNQVTLTITNGITPIEGATVVLNATTLTTNSEGIVTFNGIASGNYDVNVSKNGFSSQEILLEVVDNVDKTIILNFSTNINTRDINMPAVYPNPMQDNLKVEISNLQNEMCYRLVNLTGNIIVQGCSTSPNTIIASHHLPAGIYLLELKWDGKTQVFKVKKM